MKLRVTSYTLAAIVCLFNACAVRAQDPDLAKLAEQTEHALAAEKWNRVVVWDFLDHAGNYSKLGVKIAEDLSSLLAESRLAESHTQFTVIERSRIAQLAASERLDPKSAYDPDIARWIAKKLGADAVILGDEAVSSDGIRLQLEISNTSGARPASKKVHADLTLTDDMRDLSNQPRGDAWTLPRIAPSARNRNVRPPHCVYCPSATFSEEASHAKFQGTVTLPAIISEDGNVTNVQLVNGLPFGLNEQAIDAVRNWKLTPAQGPDGDPVAMTMAIEVAFHRY